MGNVILLECFPSPTSGFYDKAVGKIEKKFRYFLAYLANSLTKKLLLTTFLPPPPQKKKKQAKKPSQNGCIFVKKGAWESEPFIVDTLLDDVAANRSGCKNCNNQLKRSHDLPIKWS